jgi:4-amino-4-deoxy-L-arabinose transferase-like glycosyltransferase
MKRIFGQEKDRSFIAILAVALLVGIFLRSYLLSSQVFIDDEWHGFFYAFHKGPFFLLTHFSVPGATCIPLNFYCWLLGKTIGWSEISLRVPTWLFGVLCVLLCPLFAEKVIGRQRAAWLALLLAISPLLIFYSRICRPYSAVAFFGFAAVLLAARWMQTGTLRYGIGFAIAGVLAFYFHLYAVVIAGTPVFTAILLYLYSRFVKKNKTVAGPPLQHLLAIAAGMAVAGAILVLPALIRSLRSTFFDVAGHGTPEWKSVPHVLSLFSGTGQPVLVAVFWLLLGIGAVEQVRRNPWFGSTLLILYPLHALALLLSRPDGAQSAIVVTRYCIPLVPISLLLVACGLQRIFDFLASRMALRPALQTVLGVGYIAALAFAGPLPQTYVSPNNFTSHGAFQHRYGLIDWSHSFSSDITPPEFTINTVLRAEEVSPFYMELGKSTGSRPIVEFPMLIGDHFNPLYYYQHFHHRPIIVGYASDVNLGEGLSTGGVYGDTYVDQVLSLVPKISQLKFRTFIPMEDLAAIRARNVQYIIIHKRFEAQLSDILMPLPDIRSLQREYNLKIGPPFYEDEHIVVYRL